jgi:hypothetical protein
MRSAAWPFAIVAVFALAMLFAANWIRNADAAFRVAEIERGAVGSLTQVFRLCLCGPDGTSRLLLPAVKVAERDCFAARTDAGRGRQTDSWIVDVSHRILAADGRANGVGTFIANMNHEL